MCRNIAALLAVGGARSLTSGEVIDPRWYMTSGDTRPFVPVFSRAELDEAFIGNQTSAKILANVVLDDLFDAIQDGTRSAKELIKGMVRGGRWDVLESQAINQEAATALMDDDIIKFMVVRSFALMERAQVLVEGELDFDAS
jgi:hypothetical protein